MRAVTVSILVVGLVGGAAFAEPPKWFGDGEQRVAFEAARAQGKPLLVHVYDGE